jgi:hypothetical protein
VKHIKKMKTNTHSALKVFATLLPTIVLLVDWTWISDNRVDGWAFIILWALLVWNLWGVTNKDRILKRIFRITEIGFFLMPIAALILTFIIGSGAVSSANGNNAAQAGAAIGTAIGGFLAVGIGLVIGIIGGIIFHIVANRYEKKLKDVPEEEKPNSFFAKHKTAETIIVLLILVIAAANTSGSTATGDSSSNSAPAQATTASQQAPIDVTAAQLVSAYGANQVAADAKYKGQILQISGTVDGIGKDILNDPYVSLVGDPTNPLADVQCQFSQNDESALSALSKGQQITLEGTGDGMTIETVEVSNCSIVK